MKQPKIRIEVFYDGFDIYVDGERHTFPQEELGEVGQRMVDLFSNMGYNDVQYVDVY